MRGAGVSIESLIDYVKMFQEGSVTIQARKQLLIEEYENLSERIAEMQSVQEKLKAKIDNYENIMLKYEEENLKK